MVRQERRESFMGNRDSRFGHEVGGMGRGRPPERERGRYGEDLEREGVVWVDRLGGSVRDMGF